MKNLFILLCFIFVLVDCQYVPVPGKNAEKLRKERMNRVPNGGLLSPNDLPDEVDYCAKGLCLSVRQQHSPKYCGACFLFATTSVWSDRLNIMLGAKVAPMLSVQAGLDCVELGTCDGGEDMMVWKMLNEMGIPDETCSPYMSEVVSCRPDNECYFYTPDGERKIVSDYERYFVDDWGLFEPNGTSMELQMKQHIATNGPIACIIESPPIDDWNSSGVFRMDKDIWLWDHYIEIVGYGVDNEIPFWKVKNSWGSFWNRPLEGFIKIERGKNTLGIESLCSWALPRVPIM